MPRFFFDLRDGEFIRDDVGVELPDIDHAMTEAKRMLAQLVKERSADPSAEQLLIDIRTPNSEDVVTVVATTLVEHTKNVPR